MVSFKGQCVFAHMIVMSSLIVVTYECMDEIIQVFLINKISEEELRPEHTKLMQSHMICPDVRPVLLH